MNKLLRYSALAVFVGTGMSVAHADEATTTGGIKIKSSDGNFDASLGGRIHFDGEVVSPDKNSNFNSGAGDTKSSFYFRRVFISLAGHLYGFEYHIDEDLSSTSNPGNGFNDVWIAHSVFGSDTLYVGQHKPWRSLDELSSNNIIPFQERNILSANGLYGGRDFTDGVFYKWTHGFTGHDNLFVGASFYSLNKLGTSGPSPSCTVTVTGGNAGETATCKVTGAGTAVANNTQGIGYNARVAYAPLVDADKWAHVGFSYTSDNADSGGYGDGGLSSGYSTYYGRQGSGATLVKYGTVSTGGAGNPHVDVLHGELAGAFGPVHLLGEAGNASYHQVGKHADKVNAYSAEVTWAVTGETRPYDKGVASYGAIKPKHAFGAVEVGVRYDFEKDIGSFGGGCASVSAKAGGALGGPVDKCDVSAITVGATYYPNPAVRFMINYEHGDFDLGSAGRDKPDAVMGRAQISF